MICWYLLDGQDEAGDLNPRVSKPSEVVLSRVSYKKRETTCL